MARLPGPGSDDGQWGRHLNDFLLTSHRTDGKLKNLMPIANIKDFGAIGDGELHPLSERFPTLIKAQRQYPHATNLNNATDWAALQAAINSGKRVFVPAGKYIISDTIEYSFESKEAQGLILIGAGNLKTIFVPKFENAPLLKIHQVHPNAYSWGGYLADFGIVDETHPPQMGINGLEINASHTYTIERLHIQGLLGSGITLKCNHGDADFSTLIEIKNSYFENCGEWGIEQVANSNPAFLGLIYMATT